MSRDEAAQRPPAPKLDLSGFPAKRLREGTVWRRAHRSAHEPWFYAAGRGGRFDLPAPSGTCYLATTPETAAREIIGPDFIATGVVPDTLLTDRVVSEVLLPHAVRAARLTSSDAFGFGITNELCSSTDYSTAQQWAAALHHHRFNGIWYQPRFSPGSGRALALFGPSGPRDGTALTQTPLATVVRTMSGLTIAQTNDRREYEILDEP